MFKPALNNPAAIRLHDTLEAWTQAGWLRPLDWAFGRFLWSEAPDASPWLIMAATLASHQLGRGHVCLNLEATLEDPSLALSLPPEGAELADMEAGTPPPSPQEVFADLTLPAWLESLQHHLLTHSEHAATPLVLTEHRLYLRRFWAYEQQVLNQIARRLNPLATTPIHHPAAGDIGAALAELFPDSCDSVDWQKLACALSLKSRFSIITGGPGTGKTTTVLKVLALLQTLALADTQKPRALRIQLAAPTGKAAARLSQSIATRVESLNLSKLANAERVRATIPRTVTTLHRLLGSRPDTRHFRHDAHNPLRLDVLVVDEASMIDLEMMAAVLRALPADARLILLGDKDQLASVEAGAVLGELCRRAEQGHTTPETRDWLMTTCGMRVPDALLDGQGSPLDQAVTMLRHSHRFSAESGIGQLARAVNDGQVQGALAILKQPPADLAHLTIRASEDAGFATLVIEGGPVAQSCIRHGVDECSRVGYGHYLSLLGADHRPAADALTEEWDLWAQRVLDAHTRFQLLCAVRKGPWGVEGLNQRIEALLAREGYISKQVDWYEGRPVLVTRNDYGLGLMNGDIGVTLSVPIPGQTEPGLRVAFPSHDATHPVRWVTPTRLSAVETVFALTVHKSQGSEFTHAALVLPNRSNPILTRELLYTGITRASHWFTLANAGDSHTLAQAIERRVLRSSGLNVDWKTPPVGAA